MKNGFKLQKQRYLCKSCGKQFVIRQVIDSQSLYDDCVFGKQTLKQLSQKYKLSVSSRLRSAYLSIKRNMPYLWTWYDNIDIGIPNTNNGLEGKFSDLKSKLRNHNGLSKEHRMVFIDEYFRATFLVWGCLIRQPQTKFPSFLLTIKPDLQITHRLQIGVSKA